MQFTVAWSPQLDLARRPSSSRFAPPARAKDGATEKVPLMKTLLLGMGKGQPAIYKWDAHDISWYKNIWYMIQPRTASCGFNGILRRSRFRWDLGLYNPTMVTWMSKPCREKNQKRRQLGIHRALHPYGYGSKLGTNGPTACFVLALTHSGRLIIFDPYPYWASEPAFLDFLVDTRAMWATRDVSEFQVATLAICTSQRVQATCQSPHWADGIIYIYIYVYIYIIYIYGYLVVSALTLEMDHPGGTFPRCVWCPQPLQPCRRGQSGQVPWPLVASSMLLGSTWWARGWRVPFGNFAVCELQMAKFPKFL